MRRNSVHRTSARRASARSRGEAGAALVEFALVLPLLVVLMLGTITAGLVLNDDLQLNHSTRDGARYGATVAADETFGSGTWATNVRTVVLERFGSGLTAADVCVALVEGSPATPLSANHTTDSGGAACYDDSASGVLDTRVQVSATKDGEIETGLYTFALTLSSDTVTMHESNV